MQTRGAPSPTNATLKSVRVAIACIRHIPVTIHPSIAASVQVIIRSLLTCRRFLLCFRRRLDLLLRYQSEAEHEERVIGASVLEHVPE